MAPETISIDLGELPREAPALPPVPWVPWQRLRHRLHRSPWWLGLVTLLTLLTMATLTGAAPQPGPALVPQFTVSAGTVFWDDRHLYALERPRSGGEITLTAHRLVDGSVAWQTATPGQGRDAWIASSHGLLLLSTASGTDGMATFDTITRLDPDSGKPLWTSAGSLENVVGDRLLTRRWRPESEFDPFDPDLNAELFAVDATTGDVAWQIDFTGWNLAVDRADGGRLLTLDAHGRLRSYHVGSGSLLATAAIEPLGGPETGVEPDSAGAGGEAGFHEINLLPEPARATAIVRQADQRRVTLSGYDTTTLELLWTATERTAQYPDGIALWPQVCGALVCLTGPDGLPRGVDPRTGRSVWTAGWLDRGDGDRPSHAFLTAPTHPDLDGYLVILASYGLQSLSWLVDSATGEPVLELGGWYVHTAPAELGGPLLAVLPPDHMEPAPQPTWLGRLRADLTRIDPIAALDTSNQWCDLGPGGYVICQADSADLADTRSITVWLVR